MCRLSGNGCVGGATVSFRYTPPANDGCVQNAITVSRPRKMVVEWGAAGPAFIALATATSAETTVDIYNGTVWTTSQSRLAMTKIALGGPGGASQCLESGCLYDTEYCDESVSFPGQCGMPAQTPGT